MDRSLPFHPTSRKTTGILRRAGIVLGSAVVGLVLIGQGIFLARALTSEGTNYTSSVPRAGTVTQQIGALLSAALGRSDRGVQRYRIDSTIPDPTHPAMWNVRINWAINDDVSAGSIGNGAQQDVYTVLRDLYTAGLPLGRVQLTGTYPMRRNGHMRETVVMRLAMNRSTARTIGQVGWDTLDPQTLWPLVTRLWVAPEMQPVTGG